MKAEATPDTVTLSLVPESESRQLYSHANAMLAQIEALRVDTPDEFRDAGVLTVGIAKQREEVKQRLKGDIADPAYRVYKAAYSLWQQVDAPYERAENILSSKLTAFRDREEAVRRTAEAEARRKAEEEARAKQAELIRIAEEARQAEITRLKAELEAAMREEAARLKAAGDRAGAERARKAALNIPPPEVAPIEVQVVQPVPVAAIASTVPKVNGLSFMIEWKWGVTNPTLIPREYMIPEHPDEVAIGNVVRKEKDRTNIPGIKVFSVEVSRKARK